MPRLSIVFIRTAALAVVAALAMVGPISAREPVDPDTLNPPPPDFFGASCVLVGRGITCTLAFDDPPIVDEPSGIVCDGVELLFSQTRSVVGKRYYDADGNLLQRHFREDMAGTLTNAETDAVAPWVAHNTIIHDLAVPGDVLTGTTRITGGQMRVSLPRGGTILVDAGRIILDEATGEILASSGPHHFDDYFVRGDPDALAPICDALD